MPKPRFNPDTGISEFLPLSTHVSPTVIKTRSGDFMLTWRLEGLPFVGHEERELEHRHATFNRMLQTLRAPDFTNVAFWAHDLRRRHRIKDVSQFKQVFNQRLSNAYYDGLSTQKLMQNELYLTLLYRPVVSGKRFAEKSADAQRLQSEQQQAIDTVLELAGNMEAVLQDYAPTRLGLYETADGTVFSEALEFFGYLLNRIDEPVPVLSAPIYRYLPVSRQRFSAKTGDYVITTPTGVNHYGALLNIKEYPDGTWPGILNGHKYLDFEYVITHSFSPVGRHDALKALERTKGMMISSGDKAVSQITELDQAMDQLASGNFVLGQYHFSLAVHATSQEQLAQNVAVARAELSNAGFVSVKEDLAASAAFYAQFPGNWQYRTRLANVSSLNFLGLSPLHNFATGKKDHNPWGPCITTLQTVNGQPFFFNFHATLPHEDSLGEKVIGNTMVIGKSGTGKTALINFLLSQAQKLDPPPTIFFFDKDRGAEIFVRACGGNYLALETGQPTGFNPFHCDNTPANIHFLSQLIKMLAGKDAYTAREDEEIATAVANMLDVKQRLRSMTNFYKSLPNTGEDSVFTRIKRWTREGSLGWVFDNPEDTIDLQKANIIGFDYTELIDNPEVRPPVISYLLHRLEELIDGRRLIYVMDEFWKILDGGEELKDFAKNKQKTIRKQNGLGIFATQSPEDALSSDIAPALIEQTATMILLPNPNANREDYIDGLKLTEAEYKIIASLDERSRRFLIRQGHDSNVCQLDLHGMDDALAVISASTDNIEILHQILEERAQAEGTDINGLRPEHWLQAFYDRRKGSGKDPSKAQPQGHAQNMESTRRAA